MGQTTGINYTQTFAATALAYNSAAPAGQVDLFTAPGTDDALTSFPASAIVGWGGFFYGGVWYPQATTTFYVSTNGWVAVAKTGDPVPATSLPINSLANNPYRIMAPLWDDLKMHPVSGSRITYKNTGGATTRALVIEWKGMYWDKNGSDSAISFQVRICNNANTATGPNVIEFKYKSNGSSTYGLPIPTSQVGASVGLNGFCSNDIYAATSANISPISKSLPEYQLQSKPGDGTYRFTPVAHPNNDCTAPYSITFNPRFSTISTLGTTLHSTQSVGALPSCGGTTTTSDVWYKFTKPATISNFEIFTDSQDCRGANYNVGIEVYSTFTCPVGAPLICDFGSTGPAGTNATSYISFSGLPCTSQDYLIRVFSTDTLYRGYFRFNIRPPGRNCAFANDITGCCAGLPFNYTSDTLSTCGFGNDIDSNAACLSLVERGLDYVFKLTPCATMCATLNLNGTTAGANPGMFLYANSPCAGGAVCRGNVATSGGGTLTFANTVLVSGITYYIVIDFDSGGATPCLDGWVFSISGAVPSSPPNDLCANAINISVGVASSCQGGTDYSNSCATPSAAGTVPAPCGLTNFADGITPDVWFTFTSFSALPHQINVDPGFSSSAQDLSMAVYTGTCAGGLTLVPGACDDNSNGLMPSLSITPASAGILYFVRVWSNNGTKAGNFRICVIQGCTPPNDLCAGVVTLQNGQPMIGDNGCSTGTAEPNNGSLSGVGASCWTNSGGAGQLHTVWYNFIATNAQMRIRLRLLTMFDSQMALYSSSTQTCAGTFTQIFCNDNGPNTCGAGGTIRWSEITATGLMVGNTYFLRVDGLNANTGTFELTLVEGNNPFPPINVQDCALAQSICSSSNFVLADPGYQGTGNICDMPNGGSTCMASGERGASWFTWSVTGAPVTGTYMNFLITPNSPTDYDFILYVIDTVTNGGDGIPAVPNYCNQLTNASAFPAVACNWSACGNTGCNQSQGTLNIPGGYVQGGAGAPCVIPAILVPPGMTATFLLQASNFTTSTSGFTLNFQGTPINGSPPSMIWTGANNSTTWAQTLNWSPSNCGAVPDCINLIPAFIGTGAFQPTITVNTNVKDLTINPGAVLTIAPGITLSVCGNFTNNGTLSCGLGANVTFIGTANQSINGTFASAANNFYNLLVSKPSGTLTFNTNIYCLGNFSNNNFGTGIVNFNNKNLEIGGNFYNYNGNTSIVGIGSGVGGSTLTFNRRSGVNQLFQNDGTTLTLNNVNIRQIATGGTITLNGNATSDMNIGTGGVLSLGTGGAGQSGVIITPAGARRVNIWNSAAAACTAGSTDSYISGKLRRVIATGLNSYDFPVGDIAKGYERANINYTTGPGAVFSLLAQFKVWNGANCAFPGNGPAASECVTATYNALPYFNHGYWNIDADSGAATGTYQATMYNTAMTNNTGMGWTVVKANSGSCAFSLIGNCFAGSTAAATRRDNLSGFSDFATVQSQTPLPIELLSFDAKANNIGVLCSWVTATETNNDHFDVERSADGNNFKKIGEMKGFGAGTSVHNMDYKFQDEEACTGTIYYRLKQVDIDGRYTYSDVVAVDCKKSLVSLAPNPARTSVNLNFYVPQGGNVKVEITDMIGQVMLTRSFDVEKGFNDRDLDISSLANGVFYLKIISSDSHPTQVARQIKFLKY